MNNQTSSGNVYADLGYEEPENMLVRARLAIAIDELIKKEGWSRREAARRLHTTESKLSNIVRGRIRHISVDKLINMLAAAGHHVTVTVDNAA